MFASAKLMISAVICMMVLTLFGNLVPLMIMGYKTIGTETAIILFGNLVLPLMMIHIKDNRC